MYKTWFQHCSGWVCGVGIWAEISFSFSSLFPACFLFSSHGCKSANTLIQWTVVCTFVSGVHTLVNMVARLIIVKQCGTDMMREYNYATLNSSVYFSSSAHGGMTLFFANPLQIKDRHCVGLSFIIVFLAVRVCPICIHHVCFDCCVVLLVLVRTKHIRMLWHGELNTSGQQHGELSFWDSCTWRIKHLGQTWWELEYIKHSRITSHEEINTTGHGQLNT